MILPAHLTNSQFTILASKYERALFKHHSICGTKVYRQITTDFPAIKLFISHTFCAECGMNLMIIIRNTK